MRYTKELQEKVCDEINQGVSPEECARKHGLSADVVIKWTKVNLTAQRAAEVAVRKYQTEVTAAECEITNEVSPLLDTEIDDKDYLKMCEKITKSLYGLVSNVVIKERDINISQKSSRETAAILKIADKWRQNPFIGIWRRRSDSSEQ